MSEPTRFGGHGMRGGALFVFLGSALALPHVLALLDSGPGPTAAGAALTLAAGVGLGRVAYRTDEGVGCLKALALGARGVYIGRPFLYGLGAMGEQGVTRCLEIIRNELDLTMAFCGLRDVAQVDNNILLPGSYPAR
jgi:hypothetical protein